MATADELLAGVSVVDKTLVIDNDFRTISIPSSVPNLGVEFDDEVLRLEFKMPRYVSDTDLSEFAIRINYINAQGESDVYTIRPEDVGVHDDHLTFSWLVGPTATRYKGDTRFIVCAKTLNDDGTVDKEFNTTIASMKVLEGLEVDEAVVTGYTDIIEQWRRELFGIGDTEEASIKAVSAAEQAAIKDRGVEVLASIPQDYQTAVSMTDNADRTKSDAIVCLARGEVIEVKDSSDDYLRGLRIFGKTTESGDVENPTITINGSSAKTPQHIMLAYTLKAVPVSENGTYVDSDGQNWLADEIDFEHGVCIQRVGFDDPVITPLKAEEIEWFRFAHTNFYETTVSNDAGATMELKYNADTKIWLDNMPKVTDEQAGPLVEAWMNEHFTDEEGVMYGKSAYEIALSRGFVGSEEQWLASLNGRTPVKGIDYYTEEDRKEFAAGVLDDIEHAEYTATPETLAGLIASAPAGAIIRLTSGTAEDILEYDIIELRGRDSYPENLTIIGCEGATVNGVSITSGVKSDTLDGSSDISTAILPQGLTFKDITFTDNFSLRNARVDNLTINHCTFNEGTNINITPEYFLDGYGDDRKSVPPGNGVASYYRYPYAHLKQKNTTIRDCTIIDSTEAKYVSGSRTSAITVVGVDGVTIYQNTIGGSNFNGIQVGGAVGGTPDYHITTTGKISIAKNTISNTQSRGINVHTVYSGDVTVAENDLANVNLNGQYKDIIVAQGCNDTPFAWLVGGKNQHNTYDGNDISVGSGIELYNITVIENVHTNQPKTYIVHSPSSLSYAIMSAEPGATIRLKPGEYKLLLMSTENVIESMKDNYFWSAKYAHNKSDATKNYTLVTAFPENLTLEGEPGVYMNGLCITSGVSRSKGSGKHIARLPDGLTIKNVSFRDSISIRNCEWSDLSIIGCKFVDNAQITMRPNNFSDSIYGSDPGSGDANRLGEYEVTIHNVTIDGCEFIFDGEESEIQRKEAIALYNVDGAVITNNAIKSCLQKGIFVTSGHTNHVLKSRGKYLISNNVISRITSTSQSNPCGGISFYYASDVNAEVLNNTLSDIGPRALIVHNCKNSTFTSANNTDDGVVVTLYDDGGNSLPHEKLTNNPHGVTAAQVGAHPNTWKPTAAQIGLGNVNNTSDMDKPVSTAVQTALDLKADKATTMSINAKVYELKGGSTEKDLERELDLLLNQMPSVQSALPVMVRWDGDGTFGVQLLGFLYKADNNYAVLELHTYGMGQYKKYKSNGIWYKTYFADPNFAFDSSTGTLTITTDEKMGKQST